MICSVTITKLEEAVVSLSAGADGMGRSSQTGGSAQPPVCWDDLPIEDDVDDGAAVVVGRMFFAFFVCVNLLREASSSPRLTEPASSSEYS